ncbi:MAG: hypothetical protein JXX28_00065 [Deltaproteobacteria bacterium]|nr:hypothetical protein [Deltaproteobacteria bacterium]
MALWFLLPMLVAALGAIGTWLGAGAAVEAMLSASADQRMVSALSGMISALQPDLLSRWVGAFLFIAIAWGAGLAAALGAGAERRWTIGASVISGIVTLISTGALVAYWSSNGQGGAGYLFAGMLLVGGIGVAVGSVRRALEEDTHRVAAFRFTSGIALMMAISYGGHALSIDSNDALYAAILSGDSAAVDMAILQGGVISTLSWLGLGMAFLVGLVGYFSEFGDVIERRTLFDLVATLTLAVLVWGVHKVEELRVDALHDVAVLAPIAEVNSRSDLSWTKGADLPSGSLFFGSQAEWIRPMVPFFGDLVVWRKDHWVRTHTWTGKGWALDEKKLDEVKLGTEFPVLLMIGTGEPVKPVLDLLKAAQGTEVQFGLLIRVADELTEYTKAETLPSKVSMLPIALDEQPADFAGGKVWVLANSQQVYVGPVRYWGEEADNKKEIALRMDKAVEAFDAAGVQVVVSERARVRDIVDAKLAVTYKKGVDGFEPSGKWANLTVGDLEEVLVKAEEGFEAPVAEEMSLNARITKGALDKDRAVKVVEWETGALAACASGFEEGDKRGRMMLSFTITPAGRANSEMTEDRRNEVKAQPVWDCVLDRLTRISFPKVEVPEGTDPVDSEMELTLVYR